MTHSSKPTANTPPTHTTRYDIFWGYCDKAIEEMALAGAEENRHSLASYLTQPISTPAFVRTVVELITKVASPTSHTKTESIYYPVLIFNLYPI